MSYAPEAGAPAEVSEEAPLDQAWWRKLPTLFWATIILFSVNLLIGGSLLLTQPLKVDAYGQELTEGDIVNGWRPSPFTQVVNSAKREIRKPEHIYPAAFVAPEPSYSWAPAEPDSYSYVHTHLDSAPVNPSAMAAPAVYDTERSAWVQHADFSSANAATPRKQHRMESETELDIPRVTASVTRTPRAVRLGGFNILPRESVSEHSETATN